MQTCGRNNLKEIAKKTTVAVVVTLPLVMMVAVTVLGLMFTSDLGLFLITFTRF